MPGVGNLLPDVPFPPFLFLSSPMSILCYGWLCVLLAGLCTLSGSHGDVTVLLETVCVCVTYAHRPLFGTSLHPEHEKKARTESSLISVKLQLPRVFARPGGSCCTQPLPSEMLAATGGNPGRRPGAVQGARESPGGWGGGPGLAVFSHRVRGQQRTLSLKRWTDLGYALAHGRTYCFLGKLQPLP